jgi:hypothetical protein
LKIGRGNFAQLIGHGKLRLTAKLRLKIGCGGGI